MRVTLPEELKIYNVKEVWDQTSEFFQKKKKGGKKDDVIDAENLDQFDGAGLQLLFMLFREHSDGKSEFRIDGLSTDLIEKLDSYGFHVPEHDSRTDG